MTMQKRIANLKFPVLYTVYFLLFDLLWFLLHDTVVVSDIWGNESLPLVDHSYDFIFVMLNACMMFVILVFYVRREKKHAAELAESEEFYRLLFDKNPVPLIIFDIESLQIMETNNATDFLYGYAPDDMKKLKAVDLIPVEDQEKLIVNNQANKNQNAAYVGIRRHLKRDGTIMHVELYASTIIFKERKARIVKIRDITDVIKAEKAIQDSLEEKEALLQEVQHRVKNNLQVIVSLMKLQLASTDSEDVRKELLGSFSRIKTMAITYERIYHKGTLSLVQVDSLVQSLINHTRMSQLSGHEKICFKTELAGVHSNVNFAVNLALILNEIISNSIQYGFPRNQMGEITIKFFRFGDEHYVLEVGDNGIGSDKKLSLSSPESIGMQLISALALQIGAEAEMLIKDGFHYRFQIPVGFNQIMETNDLM